MRFDIEQSFDAPAARVIEVYADPGFYPSLDGLAKVGAPQVLDYQRDGNTVRLKIRYKFTADLPSAARAIIDEDKLTWVEDTTFDLVGLTTRTAILPDHYPDRLQASASARFVADGASGGSRRLITGDLKVHALLVGGQVEKAIISGMREHLADEAGVAATRLGSS